MVNSAANRDLSGPDLPAKRVSSKRPERIFCTLHEAAIFLGLPYSALKQRQKRGTLHGIARGIDGSPWTPGGRSTPLLEIRALREQLDDDAKPLLDAWREGRLTLRTIKRRMISGRD